MSDKKKPQRRYLRCSFECPAKGKFELNVWPRAGETDHDACWRALRGSRIDQAQISFCKLPRIKVLD